MIDFSIFKNKRVLLTGHTGFKGSWLLAILEKSGAKVHGLALPPGDHSHIAKLGFKRGEEDYIDIRDYQRVETTVGDFDPEIIFHLAAQPIVRQSFLEPRETFETNFMGGVNILEASRKARSLRAIVFITSDKAYENVEWEWGYRENDTLGGRDPYSASKGAVELAVSSYRRSILDTNHDLSVSTARAGNVIGGGDWAADRIVPDIIRSIQSDGVAKIRNPDSTRPWQHVLEPLSGYLLLAQRMIEAEAEILDSYNFGPDVSESKTVLDLAQGIVNAYGKGSIEVPANTLEFHEANLLQLNCERAKQSLGWFPRWGFEKTVSETAGWYEKSSRVSDVRALTDSQILDYFWELR